MSDLVHCVELPEEIGVAARRLRDRALAREIPVSQVIDVFERWGQSLIGPEIDGIPGVPFLRLWLRRGTLEPIVIRELGAGALSGEWHSDRTARLRSFPLGLVGHWPAGNIEIQPLLSLTCAALGGNCSLVRVPTGLAAATRAILAKLCDVDTDGTIAERIFVASFDHERADLQRAMAAAVDGAMIWGGAEAVTHVRALPFPPWARLAVFGPRLSVAAMDGATWSDASARQMWCQRIARDVWQFDQQACSSPQALFLEKCREGNVAEFASALAEAFTVENRMHPRQTIHPALTSAICLARATWFLGNGSRGAMFPAGPDWTLLLGDGTDIPTPTQGRTLNILIVDDLAQPVSRFDGIVQTLGLAVKDPAMEIALAERAARSGVDRITKLGRMHVFGSPWDGTELIKPMVRIVRHVPSSGD